MYRIDCACIELYKRQVRDPDVSIVTLLSHLKSLPTSPINQWELALKRHIFFCLGAMSLLAMLFAGCRRSATSDIAPAYVQALSAQPLPVSGTPLPETPSSTASLSLPVASPPAASSSTTPFAVSSTPLPAPTPSPPQACAPTSFESTGAIVIGAILPLSRPGAIGAGFAMQAALNMAMLRVNETGGVQGRPVRLITYDSAGVPRQGALFAERLITLDCASAIVGLYHNNVALAVSDVADRYGIPLILAGPHADVLTANQRATVFRIAPAQTMLDRKLAAWLTAVTASYADVFLNDGEMTVVIVAENRQQERDAVERASLWLRQAGFSVKPIFVDLPTQDYSSTIARIVTLDMFPDVIVNHLHDQPALDFHRQLLDAGVSPVRGTIIVDDAQALDDRTFWAALPDGDGTVVSKNGPWGEALTDVGREFAAEYQQMYGRWPGAYAFSAYDAFLLVTDALNRMTMLTFPNLVDTLEASDVVLASGRYTFPYGSSNPPVDELDPDYLWHQWPDPPLLFLEYAKPQQPSAEMPVLWPPSRRTAPGPYLLP